MGRACSGFPVALINDASSASCHNLAIIDHPRREGRPPCICYSCTMSSKKRPSLYNNGKEKESMDAKKKESNHAESF